MTLSAQSPEVLDFVAAYQENRNLAASRGPSGYRILVVERRKYLAIDEKPTFEGRDCPGQSGRFMVDRQTRSVYTIRAYGQRGHYVGFLANLTAEIRAGTASYDPQATMHVERPRSHVASWEPAKIAEALRRGQ